MVCLRYLALCSGDQTAEHSLFQISAFGTPYAFAGFGFQWQEIESGGRKVQFLSGNTWAKVAGDPVGLRIRCALKSSPHIDLLPVFRKASTRLFPKCLA